MERFTTTAPASELALVAHRWALLEQRASNETGARLVFKLGAKIVTSTLRANPEDDKALRANGATLFCSWALCEYRHATKLGASTQLATSVRLLEHAVLLDEQKASVLKWKRFQRREQAREDAPLHSSKLIILRREP